MKYYISDLTEASRLEDDDYLVIETPTGTKKVKSSIVRSNLAAIGNATPDDVKKGKIFSSEEGVGIKGTYVAPQKPIGDATVDDVARGKTFSNSTGVGLVGTYIPPSGPTGNARPSDVLSGRTFSNSSGTGLVGTYVPTAKATGNATAADVKKGKTFSNSTANGLTGSYTVPGNAKVSDVRKGVTFSSANGENLTGTLNVSSGSDDLIGAKRCFSLFDITRILAPRDFDATFYAGANCQVTVKTTVWGMTGYGRFRIRDRNTNSYILDETVDVGPGNTVTRTFDINLVKNHGYDLNILPYGEHDGGDTHCGLYWI